MDKEDPIKIFFDGLNQKVSGSNGSKVRGIQLLAVTTYGLMVVPTGFG